MKNSSIRRFALPALAAFSVAALSVLAFMDRRGHDKPPPNGTSPLNDHDQLSTGPQADNSRSDEFAKALTDKKWPRETAFAVAKLNQAWFDCVSGWSMLE
ncbi:MAG: hypothetical protein JWO95_1332, partial [Verrucomicrobiales bacterium]|nr:hypothetical protein [Verrucomicrobiales bacterium]